MAKTIYTTRGEATLNGSYTSGGTTLTLHAGHTLTQFSTGNGQCTLLIDNELFLATVIAATSATVTGAQEGTAAANHSNSAAVTQVMTKVVHDGMRSDQQKIGAYSSLPSTSLAQKGDVYRATDGPYEFVFDGSVWQAFHRGGLVNKPDDSVFSTVNIGTATYSLQGGMQLIAAPGTGGTAVAMRLKTMAAAAPYTITAKISGLMQDANNTFAGLVVLENGTGSLMMIGIGLGDDTQPVFVLRGSSGSISGAAAYHPKVTMDCFWVQIQAVSVVGVVTLTYRYSNDPVSSGWLDVTARLATTDFTSQPDRVGLAVNPGGGGTSTIYGGLISLLEV